MKKFWLAMAAFVMAMLPLSPAMAQSMTDEELAELAQFPLTEPLLAKLIAAAKEINTQKVDLGGGADMSKMETLAQLVGQIEASPKARDIIVRNGLTPHDFLYGMLAIADAVAAAQPGVDDVILSYTNAANIDFYKSHHTQIDAFLAGRL
ncbi:hypothetical protein MMA231_01648 [Asticcacaulis sp. MM231]|uniref:hypothetical protein n=1 Tax=Asticcacaulis sp. MM231 TaxID=3157666 RepID=UPI0032D574A8